MKVNPLFKKEIQGLFEAKLKRRRELARLPFERKILILVQLQKIGKKLPWGIPVNVRS